MQWHPCDFELEPAAAHGERGRDELVPRLLQPEQVDLGRADNDVLAREPLARAHHVDEQREGAERRLLGAS